MNKTNGSVIGEDLNNIPLVDDDPQAVVEEDEENEDLRQNGSKNNRSRGSIYSLNETESSPSHDSSDDISEENTADEIQEKVRLITQVLELQNTLDDLSHRVDSVKEENLKLRSENQVLGQYIENLMAASSVFQSTNDNSK